MNDHSSYYDNLDIYNNQFHTFEFLLENIGQFPVKEISINVYAYKKDDYKVAIDEVKLKKENGKLLIINI
jgi:hypothetical protein